MTKTNVTVTTIDQSEALVKAPGGPTRIVLIRSDESEWLPIADVTRTRDGWEIPSGLVYGRLVGAALDQARRFIAHDSRSPFTLANVALTYEDDAR